MHQYKKMENKKKSGKTLLTLKKKQIFIYVLPKSYCN
jgi:hypothetical protein